MRILVLFFFLVTHLVVSQNKVSINGSIVDQESNLPLESATVYFTKVSDSTVVDYTISNSKGNFSFNLVSINYPVELKISYAGYKEFKKKIPSLTSNLDLGILKLSENVAALNEVVVKSEAPPIRIKTDTLEFNASSFKVAPDANVEKLLKQLPGVEIDEEGKITVNGKEVNNILVNGKPFFGKDGKIATQNLPAEIINKVQVTDTKTKKEELTGKNASSDEKTINLTIDEDKNKGLFGRVNAGYGTNDRYESSLLINYFKGPQKISVLASSNNINSTGFSMDEIFDNMGGGRNRNVWISGNGTFQVNGMRFGSDKGITQSSMIGLNYADEWFNKKIDPNLNYYFSNSETNNKNRTERINLLNDGNTLTKSNSNSNTLSNGHNLGFQFEIKIDSTTTLFFNPNLQTAHSKNRYDSYRTTEDSQNTLLNDNVSNEFTTSDMVNFKNNLYLVRKLKRKGRSISANFDVNNKESNDEASIYNKTTFYQSGNTDDERNQFVKDLDRNNEYQFGLEYNEPITDSLSLGISGTYGINKSVRDKMTRDFNSAIGDYDLINDPLTSNIVSNKQTVSPRVELQLNKKNLRGFFSFGPDVVNYYNKSNYRTQETVLNSNHMLPYMRANLRYSFAKSKSIYFNADYKVNLPTANQLLPFEDLSNPLNTITGNPDLKPNENYSFYMNFNNFDFATRSGMFIWSGGDYNKYQVVSSTTYDNDFKATTTFQNIDESYSGYLGISFSRQFKKEKRTFRYRVSMTSDFNFDKGLTNAVLYEARGINLRPRASLSWSIEDLITIEPSYTYINNRTSYKNYIIDEAQNFRHNAKLEITSYWPKNFLIGSDFGYNYNSNIANGFQKDFYLWNLSLGYNFYNDRFLAKVKMYDVLNQNVSATRTISPTAITDEENTVLKQYVMFSLTYKLTKFAGKEKKSNRFWMH
ncbi:MAG: outer membrane beta-barrel protein [Flavobacteriaceae bacterium]|nr:outer membrane beta-barrel protein [Flavobacteriaceae bacterium]